MVLLICGCVVCVAGHALNGVEMGDGPGQLFDVLSGEHGLAKPIFLGGEVAFVVGDAARKGFDVLGDALDATGDVVKVGLVLLAEAFDVEGHDGHVDGDEGGDDGGEDGVG